VKRSRLEPALRDAAHGEHQAHSTFFEHHEASAERHGALTGSNLTRYEDAAGRGGVDLHPRRGAPGLIARPEFVYRRFKASPPLTRHDRRLTVTHGGRLAFSS